MGSALRFMFLDEFDPLTNHLYLRVAYHDGRDGIPQAGFQILRQSIQITETLPLETLQREFRRVLKIPMPLLWFDYLKLVIHALDLEVMKMKTNEKPNLWWVGVQCFHPTDPNRSTLHFEISEQVNILKEWIFQMEEEKDEMRYIEFLSRALLMAPQDPALLRRIVFYLKQTSQFQEAYECVKRWLMVDPDREEALCIKAELQIALGKTIKARELFETLMARNRINPKYYLGLAQTNSFLGKDPVPYLDAAVELDRVFSCEVLKSTFNYRLQERPTHGPFYDFEILPDQLGLSAGEIKKFMSGDSSITDQPIHEQELTRWVTIMNRYRLLPEAIPWNAPTPKQIERLS